MADLYLAADNSVITAQQLAKLPLDEQKRAKARGVDKQVKDAALAKGRQLERAEWCKALGVQTREEATEVAHLRKELKERPTLAEIAHARHASRGYAMVFGAIVGAAAAVIVGAVTLSQYAPALNTVVHESVLTGAVTQQLNPPVRCVPGERLPDGRVCPSVSINNQ